jgi:hypothetical protein
MVVLGWDGLGLGVQMEGWEYCPIAITNNWLKMNQVK